MRVRVYVYTHLVASPQHNFLWFHREVVSKLFFDLLKCGEGFHVQKHRLVLALAPYVL
jgi:hypothetical protein